MQEKSTLFAFLTIGLSGAIGSIVGGWVSEKIGKEFLSIFALVISSLCSIMIGFTFSAPIWITVSVAAIWGISIIADSAQFSAIVAEFSKPESLGTNLTFQMAVGFAVTIVSIYFIPFLANIVGWKWAFSALSIGPILGIWAMIYLIRYKNIRR